jgi:transcription initiation factor TFIID TATA-box-binding protein
MSEAVPPDPLRPHKTCPRLHCYVKTRPSQRRGNPVIMFFGSQEGILYLSSIVFWFRKCHRMGMVDKKYESLKIENIVASGAIAEAIDLVDFSDKTENCELNKKRFPGAVFHIADPKIACLVFSSGKIVITGVRDDKALAAGLAIILKALKAAGIAPLKEPRVAVTNIVCSYDLGRYINLNKLMVTLNMEHVEYEPEQFPGLVFRIADPKIVVLIFSSGKIILTGGKNLDDVRKGLAVLEKKLESLL